MLRSNHQLHIAAIVGPYAAILYSIIVPSHVEIEKGRRVNLASSFGKEAHGRILKYSH